MALNVTQEEFDALVQLQEQCQLPRRPPDNFDSIMWVTGCAFILNCTTDELRWRAGSFPPGEMAPVVIVSAPIQQRWV